jgi:hypothetical protein
VNPCRLCGHPAGFARSLCENVIDCNHRCRLALGMTKQVAAWWKLRDYQRMFPRRRAA